MQATNEELELLRAAEANSGRITLYTLKIDAGKTRFGEGNARAYEKYLYTLENLVAQRKMRHEANIYIVAHLGYETLDHFKE